MLQSPKTAPIRTFRLNCLPEQTPEQTQDVENLLHLEGYEFIPDDFFPPARRLLKEPQPLGLSLAAFFGYIYIQDRSSMLPPVALQPVYGAAVLDICASPGSKTGQLAGMVGQRGLVLANEPSASRLATLRRNLLIQNLPQVVSTCQTGESLPMPDQSWSYIQLDPPCSGWGTLEKNPKVQELWSGEKILRLISLQRNLLQAAARLLKPGGYLTYSTCTTNVQENEEQIAFCLNTLGLELVELPNLPGWQLDTPMMGMTGVWRVNTRPGENQGFFIAKLRKAQATWAAISTPEPAPALQYTPIPHNILLESGLDPDSLPGPLGAFAGSVHILPQKALTMLPDNLRWQGLYCGKCGKNGEVILSPRFRVGQDCKQSGPSIQLEGKSGREYLQKLLQGQSLTTQAADIQATGKTAALYWNSLPLGRVNLKNNRVLWSER